ncbi:MAG TPA: hypothetical protein VGQ26_04440 [Streptosporangiaceae bacterium]|nr:hypothetical protein [Streptosporangiaceae bacterium]
MPARQGDDAMAPACGPDDVVTEVRWERDGTGLRGQVIAERTSAAGLASSRTSQP